MMVSIQEITDCYDVFIVDLWGVLYEGDNLFPKALGALRELRKLGKKVVLLSNSPHHSSHLSDRLSRKGSDFYDALYTGGQQTYQYLWDQNERNDLPKQYGQCFVMDALQHQEAWLKGLLWRSTDDINRSDFFLGLSVPDTHQPHDIYAPLLKKALSRNLVFLCANPDCVAVKNRHVQPRIGLWAKFYENLGGYVRYFGKPDPSIYHAIKNQFGSNLRYVSIGDTLETDILGAQRVDMDSVLILSGVHDGEMRSCQKKFLMKNLRKLYETHRLSPTYVCPELTW